jgi:hypothetical protein
MADTGSEIRAVGVSTSFRLDEALDDACRQILDKIPSDHISFRIGSMSGENGGFAEVRRLEVEIFGSIKRPATT